MDKGRKDLMKLRMGFKKIYCEKRGHRMPPAHRTLEKSSPRRVIEHAD
jgi:hypothetical protein